MSSNVAMPSRHDGPVATRTWFVATEDHAHGGGATLIGFWIYLMSDALIFASLFAVFGVLGRNYAGGPGPKQLFDLSLVALNTGLLLASSITFGIAMMAMESDRVKRTMFWLVITGLLGLGFLCVEMHEFAELVAQGATPQRSAFLSIFFTLVGTHGAHVAFGLIWLVTMLIQIGQRGLHVENRRRIVCLSMFWHFLDIVWIGVFTFVYLYGVIR
ncbi:cytochrome bo3 quinol oxidase subunit 3 [Luteibacter sp. 22Crub2.1]|nr:cytochrome o ubiquinol oxidase subunit 3 [Dyella sp. 333MFSha]SKB25430.1 cytochrome bo3 quinol oxidase subunit 3 [Luteibacter sp. 22Crub2.1]